MQIYLEGIEDSHYFFEFFEHLECQDASDAKPKGSATINAPSSSVSVFELVNKKHGLHAKAMLVEGEFVGLEGSTARLSWASAAHTQHRHSPLHDDLQKSGVLNPQGPVCIFTSSYAFSSPSAAAAIVNGRPANGRIEWHVPSTQQTYHAWEAENLASHVPGDAVGE